MKIWEKCNEVKGTNATKEQIAEWAYMNKICPLEFDTALEIDLPLDKDGFPLENGFSKAAGNICSKSKCGFDCVKKYLEQEYSEVTG